jgi:MerR family mercuric resistance operon transcriptional regulator
MTEAGPLTISDLAAEAGLRPDTVRYYERVGLMPVPARTSGDHRRCPCEPAEPMLRARIAEIDAEMERLTRLRADLVAMAEQLPSATCPDPVPGTWCPPDHPKIEGRCDACSI